MTTTAMALLMTWPLEPGRRVVLAECDPDGGAILPGALQGTVANTYGLRNLALAGRQGQLADAFWRQLVDVTDAASHDRLVLPGIYDPAHASSLAPVWDQLATLFAGIEQHHHDVLVDLGRRGAFGPSAVLAKRADVVLMVARNTLRGLQSAQVRLGALREQLGGAAEIGLVLVEAGPFGREEIQRHLGAEVVAVLPWQPEHAAVLSDGAAQPRRFESGELIRAARTATTRIRQMVATRRSRLGWPTGAGGREVSGAR
ncbi:hypothetical protein [Actinacidiphila reveromycinica]|uniref:hypothetical protein n=1 Tax=Actinacidiphila reveromycinica TaxID=659352 RepID=UPI003211A245